VRTFEILCPFFNIWPNVPVFFYFFQMKLTSKIGWVSLNNMSKKLFECDSNVFHCFKENFFKVQATDIMADGLPLMFNEDGEPRFPFYWQSNPTRFKSFNKDLLTLVKKVDKAILEQLSVSLDAWAILSLPSVNE